MSFVDVVFYLFASITVMAGVGVVVARNPVSCGALSGAGILQCGRCMDAARS